MSIPTKSEIFQFVIEDVPGVYKVPAGTDAMLVYDLTPEYARGARFSERNVSRASLASQSPVFGGSLFGFTFSMELRGKGPATAGQVPQWMQLARACGCEVTVDAGNSVSLQPRSTNMEYGSALFHMVDSGGQAVRHRVSGIQGTMRLSATTGEVIALEFDMTGRLVADPDDVAAPDPSTLTFDSAVPPTFQGQDMFDWGGYFPVFNEFSLDLANEVSTPSNANSADGYGMPTITARAVAGTFDPEMTLVATQDWVGDFKAQARKAAQMQLGTAGGERITLAIPSAGYSELGAGDRDGIRVLNPGYQANEVNGDDEFTLTID